LIIFTVFSFCAVCGVYAACAVTPDRSDALTTGLVAALCALPLLSAEASAIAAKH